MTILTDITIFNANKGLTTVQGIIDALRNMYDNLDYYSRIFDLHDIACELFIEKLNMYIDIITRSSLTESIKDEVIDHYKFLKEKVVEINDKFVEDAKKKLEDLIKNREYKSKKSRADQSVSVVGANEVIVKQRDNQAASDAAKGEAEAKIQQLEALKVQLKDANIALFAATNAALAAKNNSLRSKKPSKTLPDEALLITAAKNTHDLTKRQEATAKDLVKNLDKEISSLEKDQKTHNSVIAKIIATSKKLEQELNVAVLEAKSSAHLLATDVAKEIRSQFSSFAAGFQRFVSKGGKRSIQNKQRHQRKYTKRIRKNIYRKKTLKHFKIKRPKKTKKHRGK